MTNEEVRSLNKYIKLTNVFSMLPVDIQNWPEKLSGNLVNGNKLQFSTDELSLIESAINAIADHIKSLTTKPTGRGTR